VIVGGFYHALHTDEPLKQPERKGGDRAAGCGRGFIAGLLPGFQAGYIRQAVRHFTGRPTSDPLPKLAWVQDPYGTFLLRIDAEITNLEAIVSHSIRIQPVARPISFKELDFDPLELEARVPVPAPVVHGGGYNVLITPAVSKYTSLLDDERAAPNPESVAEGAKGQVAAAAGTEKKGHGVSHKKNTYLSKKAKQVKARELKRVQEEAKEEAEASDQRSKQRYKDLKTNRKPIHLDTPPRLSDDDSMAESVGDKGSEDLEDNSGSDSNGEKNSGVGGRENNNKGSGGAKVKSGGKGKGKSSDNTGSSKGNNSGGSRVKNRGSNNSSSGGIGGGSNHSDNHSTGDLDKWDSRLWGGRSDHQQQMQQSFDEAQGRERHTGHDGGSGFGRGYGRGGVSNRGGGGGRDGGSSSRRRSSSRGSRSSNMGKDGWDSGSDSDKGGMSAQQRQLQRNQTGGHIGEGELSDDARGRTPPLAQPHEEWDDSDSGSEEDEGPQRS
jgi:hypothetical protein